MREWVGCAEYWLAPMWLAVHWLIAFIAWRCLASSRWADATQPLLGRLGWLVCVQSVVFIVGRALGLWIRSRGGNPSDAYDAASLVYALSWLVACAFGLPPVRRGSRATTSAELNTYAVEAENARLQPKQPRRWTWSRRLLFAAVALGVLGVVWPGFLDLLLAPIGVWLFALVCAGFGKVIIPPTLLPKLLGGTALLGAGLGYCEYRKFSSASASRTLAAAIIGVVLLALPIQLSCLASFYPSFEALTDVGLAADFAGSMADGERASGALQELLERPPAHLTGLASMVRAWRDRAATEGSLSAAASKAKERYRAALAATRTSDGNPAGYLGDSPYEGSAPEVELLRVLVARGELGEVHAWAQDATVPAELRARAAALLAAVEAAPPH